jgi:hypothetical protein
MSESGENAVPYQPGDMMYALARSASIELNRIECTMAMGRTCMGIGTGRLKDNRLLPSCDSLVIFFCIYNMY